MRRPPTIAILLLSWPSAVAAGGFGRNGRRRLARPAAASTSRKRRGLGDADSPTLEHTAPPTYKDPPRPLPLAQNELDPPIGPPPMEQASQPLEQASQRPFQCPDPSLMGLCTAPSPGRADHECRRRDLGQLCPDGQIGEHCCEDLCGRRYCTAKGYVPDDAGGDEEGFEEGGVGAPDGEIGGGVVIEMLPVATVPAPPEAMPEAAPEAAPASTVPPVPEATPESAPEAMPESAPNVPASPVASTNPGNAPQSPASFVCPPPQLCTAPDPSLLDHECRRRDVGKECLRGREGEHCCVDLCGRRYCTAKSWAGGEDGGLEEGQGNGRPNADANGDDDDGDADGDTEESNGADGGAAFDLVAVDESEPPTEFPTRMPVDPDEGGSAPPAEAPTRMPSPSENVDEGSNGEDFDSEDFANGMFVVPLPMEDLAAHNFDLDASEGTSANDGVALVQHDGHTPQPTLAPNNNVVRTLAPTVVATRRTPIPTELLTAPATPLPIALGGDAPTEMPTAIPTFSPTAEPTFADQDSAFPTSGETKLRPTGRPTRVRTRRPTGRPTRRPVGDEDGDGEGGGAGGVYSSSVDTSSTSSSSSSASSGSKSRKAGKRGKGSGSSSSSSSSSKSRKAGKRRRRGKGSKRSSGDSSSHDSSSSGDGSAHESRSSSSDSKSGKRSKGSGWSGDLRDWDMHGGSSGSSSKASRSR